jgi:sugar/nucleoside kinase (ribokinase family)
MSTIINGGNMAPRQKTVFISFSSKDKSFVDRLVKDLRRRNLNVWEYNSGIPVGHPIPKRISQALSKAHYYIIVLSPNSTSSNWVDTELNTAINMENMKGRNDFVIPILYQPCTIPILISSKRYANFVENYSSGLKELLRSLGLPSNVRVFAEKGTSSSKKQVSDFIVSIGGANAEYIYKLNNEIAIGQKNNTVAVAAEMVGGGGMNFASRLISTGRETFPILTIGNDRSGKTIQQELLRLAIREKLSNPLQNFINSDDFFAPDLETSYATVIVQGTKRTILSCPPKGYGNDLQEYIERRLRQVENLNGSAPKIIRISHLHDLQTQKSKQYSGSEIVKRIIQAYSDKSMIIFNPGTTQLKDGIKFWEKELQRISVLQVNMIEAKRFFAISRLPTSLVNMIEWFKSREISVVITLARFGAIGSFQDGKDGIIFAWPLELAEKDMVDPTGAGDAFAAGFASEFYENPELSFINFFTAIDQGRYWSTYACKTLGGAGDCPTASRLDDFCDEMQQRSSYRPTEIVKQSHVDDYLQLIDKAFQ